MATKFKKGDAVKLNTVVPQGQVTALRMLEDGTIQCLMSWNQDGVQQERWFNEDQLVDA
jgi:uncharacterized protein YodC (DUF2158 family)